MTTTLEQLHRDIQAMRADLAHVRRVLDEDWDLADDVVDEIERSRKRPPQELISNEEMRAEFGVR